MSATRWSFIGLLCQNLDEIKDTAGDNSSDTYTTGAVDETPILPQPATHGVFNSARRTWFCGTNLLAFSVGADRNPGGGWTWDLKDGGWACFLV
jgi:hypothetical protein